MCVICSTFWAPKFCFPNALLQLAFVCLYYIQSACVSAARVRVCIGVRAFLGVRFLVFREILAFICYVLKTDVAAEQLLLRCCCSVAAAASSSSSSSSSFFFFYPLRPAIPLLCFSLRVRECVGSPMYTIWQLQSALYIYTLAHLSHTYIFTYIYICLYINMFACLCFLLLLWGSFFNNMLRQKNVKFYVCTLHFYVPAQSITF